MSTPEKLQELIDSSNRTLDNLMNPKPKEPEIIAEVIEEPSLLVMVDSADEVNQAEFYPADAYSAPMMRARETWICPSCKKPQITYGLSGMNKDKIFGEYGEPVEVCGLCQMLYIEKEHKKNPSFTEANLPDDSAYSFCKCGHNYNAHNKSYGRGSCAASIHFKLKTCPCSMYDPVGKAIPSTMDSSFANKYGSIVAQMLGVNVPSSGGGGGGASSFLGNTVSYR